jgi:cytochrome c oxidase cbb3-type subunit 2
MPASRHLFRTGQAGAPEPTEEARQLVAYLQTLGRQRRDVWAEFRSREPLIPGPGDAPAADRLERGDRLYRQHCAACHGAGGDGRGPAAALLLFPPRDFTAGLYRFRSAPASGAPRDADLFRAITLGTGTGSAMPAFYFLSDQERWALVLRIKEFSPALRGRGLGAEGATEQPPPAPARNEATERERGKALWDRLECATCHGVRGRGMSRREAGTLWADAAGVAVPQSGDLTHACSRRGGGSEEAFARALAFGVGAAMPSFAQDLGDPIDAARALIRHLEAGQDAGR